MVDIEDSFRTNFTYFFYFPKIRHISSEFLALTDKHYWEHGFKNTSLCNFGYPGLLTFSWFEATRKQKTFW